MARRFFRAFSANSGKHLREALGTHCNPGTSPRAAVRAAKLARQQAGMNELQRQRHLLKPPAAPPPAAPRTNHYRQCHLLGEPFPSSRMTPGGEEVRRLAPTDPEPIAAPNYVYAHLGEPWPSTRWDAEQPSAGMTHQQTPATRDSRVLPASELHRAITTTAAAAAVSQSDDEVFFRNHSTPRMADRDATVQVGTGIPMSAIGTENTAVAIRAAVLLFAAVDVNGGSKQTTKNGVVATAAPAYRQYLAQQVVKRAKQRQQQSQQTSIASQPANAAAATHWGSKGHQERRFLSSGATISTEADGDLRTTHPSTPVVRYGAPVSLPYNSMVSSPGRKWSRLHSRPGGGLSGRNPMAVAGAIRRTLASQTRSHSIEATAKATARLEAIKKNVRRHELKAQLKEIRQKTDLTNAKIAGPN